MFYKLVQLFKSFTPKERYAFSAALLVFVVSAITLSVTSFYQSTTAQPIEGGSYTEGIIGQPVAINPLIVGDNDADRDLISLLFASLFDLTESYKVDEDQKVWNLTLKPDLKWSDGRPLTSSDVVFTIGIIQDPDTRSSLFATWQGVLAERISEREIRLSLKNSYAFFLDNINNLRIAPQHIFENIPPQNFHLSDFNLKPVGSGPYKFVDFSKRTDGFIENYSLVANKFYALEQPFIQKLSVRFFSNKLDAIGAFNIGKVDGIGGLDHNDLTDIKINHQILSVNRPRYYAVFFNQSTSRPLKDEPVRAALNLATDKGRIVTEVLGGEGLTVDGPIPPSLIGYDPSIYAEDMFSIDEATSTLEKAGWKLNEEGIRSKVIAGNRISLEFDVIVPETKFLIDTARILQEDWAKIGVGLNPVILKLSDVISGALKPRNYHMIIFGNTLNNNPDVFSFWHSSQRFDPGLNLSLFNNKRVDGLLESLRQNINEAERLEDLSSLQEEIHEEIPALFLYSPQFLYLTSKNLGGFTAESIAASSDRFQNVNGWFLKTARVFK